MFSLRNKNKIIKIAMILIFAFLFLTACSSDGAKMTPEEVEGVNYAESQANAMTNCWQATIIDIFYKTTSSIIVMTLSKFTEGALAIAMIFFAIWLIIKLISYTSSVTENSGAELWNEIFKKLFLCFVCGTIANNPSMIIWLINTIIFPVYTSLLKVGSEVVSIASKASIDVGLDREGTNDCSTLGGSMDMTMAGMPEYPRNMMGCLICNVNTQMSIGLALTFKLFGTPGVGFLGWLSAALLGITFTIVRLGFVFYLVDTLFKMALMFILFPLFILGYAFEYTKGYFTKAFSNIISSAAYMLVISIITSISIMAVTSYLTKALPELSNPAMLENKEALEKYESANSPVLIILCFAFLVVKTLDIAQELANNLILPEKSITNTMQQAIKGALVKAAKIVAAIMGSPIAKKLIDKAAKKVKSSNTYQNLKGTWAGRQSSKIAGGVRNVRTKIGNFNKKLNKLSGRDEK